MVTICTGWLSLRRAVLLILRGHGQAVSCFLPVALLLLCPTRMWWFPLEGEQVPHCFLGWTTSAFMAGSWQNVQLLLPGAHVTTPVLQMCSSLPALPKPITCCLGYPKCLCGFTAFETIFPLLMEIHIWFSGGFGTWRMCLEFFLAGFPPQLGVIQWQMKLLFSFQSHFWRRFPCRTGIDSY